MAVNVKQQAISDVKDLAEAFSKHAKYVNQVWFVTIVAAAVILFPIEEDSKFLLPFSLGAVNKSTYDPIGYSILFVLIVAYCQGYAKAFDVRTFAHNQIDQLEKKYPDVRDYYDFFVVDAIARVWPLISLMRYRFRAPKCAAKVFYVVLKILTQSVLLGLPVVAFSMVLVRMFHNESNQVVLWLASAAAVVLATAVVEVILTETMVVKKVLARLEDDQNTERK